MWAGGQEKVSFSDSFSMHFSGTYYILDGLPRWCSDKESACQCWKRRRCGFDPWVGKILGAPGGSDGKESACSAGDSGSIPGLGRSPGEGNGNPLQYSCLEKPMDGGVWWATVHGVTMNWPQLSDFTWKDTLEEEIATHSSILA